MPIISEARVRPALGGMHPTQAANVAHIAQLASRYESNNSGLAMAALADQQPLFVPIRGFVGNWKNFGGTQRIAQVNIQGGVVQVRGRLNKSSGNAAVEQLCDLPTGYEISSTTQEAGPAAFVDGSSAPQLASITFNPLMTAASGNLLAIPGIQLTVAGTPTITVLDLNSQFASNPSFLGSAAYQRNAAVSDDTAVLIPTSALIPDATIKVCFFFHGASDDYLSHITSPISATSTQRLTRSLITSLLGDGWIIISSTGGTISDHWGNPASWAATQAALTWVRARFNVTKVVAFGQSMGGLSSLRAVAYDSLITNIAAVYPAANLQSIYDAGTYTANINTAFGGAPAFASNVAACDPMQFPGTVWAGKKFLAYASPSDVSVPKATNADVIAAKIIANGGTATVNATTGLHGDTSNWTVANTTAILAHLNS